MTKAEAIEALEELGVTDIERVEGGVIVNIFVHEALLENLVELVELTEKLDNS